MKQITLEQTSDLITTALIITAVSENVDEDIEFSIGQLKIIRKEMELALNANEK